MTARPQDVALLPCPFCGEAPDAWSSGQSEGGDYRTMHHVGCRIRACFRPVCTVPGPWGYARPDDLPTDEAAVQKATAAWNTRANLSAALASAQAREEELRAEVEFHKLDAGALRVQMDVLRDGLDVQRRNAQTALTWFEDERGRAVRLAEALRDMLEHYVSLANSGDAGNWDPEKEPQVIAARAALSTNAAQPGETTLDAAGSAEGRGDG